MAKALKLWNGRAGRVSRLIGVDSYRSCHMFVAAYSMADALRMLDELMDGRSDVTAHEIKEYWSANAWGIHMDGITPERGIWLRNESGANTKPVRVYPEPDCLPIGTLDCPDDGERLYFETWGGMRVRQAVKSMFAKGRHVYQAMCPECRKHWNVKAARELGDE